MSGPKCPKCEIEGIEQIATEESNERSMGGPHWFEVAFCKNCGHIYGVFAKHILSHQVN